MHLSLLLDMAADAMGDRRAVTAPEGELTFAELRDAAVTAAGVLGEPGGRTVQLGVNSLAVPIALLAASQAGTAFTPLNYRLADADLRRIAERAAPAVAIVDDEMVSRLDGVEGLEIITRSELLEGVTGGEVVTIPETGDPSAAGPNAAPHPARDRRGG
jgi:acyl-CoA synthetase (AMP-forming)/AMP-acid ligase II